ncbi:sensor domain-containing diguanylate cyclase [Aquibacillus rhizosphaerae]|uniref:Sensor domain-containing diguanylate cyclase n=1 Tax=Aquibacillus rhizosphaerae TaxID=3051431 RepID=A0ABT7L651_9BACI|nr:sensor domain-containing diguanylate cyclase [Aquibacillus sp. LR5S19]MDL4841349.1 sensor domain-containing diguanylate cyclase [Aquibacillus sp. LR5S19]
MEINASSWQKELQAIYSEKFIYNTNSFNDDTISEVAMLIKQLIKANCTAIYLYNSWKDDYVLSATSTCEANTLKPSLFEDSEVVEFSYDYTAQCFSVYEGKDLFEEPTKDLSYLMPLNSGKQPLGFLLVTFESCMANDAIYQQLDGVASETFKLLNRLGDFSQTKEKANKYELLYRVTRKFHSSINTHDVLVEVIKTLRDVYPQFNYNLYLSQDYQNDSELPIKELIYNEEFANKSSVQAFLTGKVQMEHNTNNTKSRLFAPLKGKQGVYGVLQITAPNTLLFPSKDIEFITLLAITAGNALENAHLYQQSQQLISDLQLINETSHILNSNLRLTETTFFMNKQIRSSFNPEEVGFVLFKDNNYQVLEGSSSYFLLSESSLFLEKIFPTLKIEKESLFVGDYNSKYSDSSFKYLSVIAIPMVQSQQAIGAIIVLHPSAYYFSFETFKLIKSLVHHSTLAFVNSILREQLEDLVITDYLSKLFSRKYLDEKLQEHINTDNQGSFLLIDIDDFKNINDTYGHDLGDELIVQVANIIKDNIDELGFAARWGGEELAVYLPKSTLDEAIEIAEKLVKLVERGTEPCVTISIGVSHWDVKNSTRDKELAHILFEKADKALYNAKRNGKNCVVQAN